MIGQTRLSPSPRCERTCDEGFFFPIFPRTGVDTLSTIVIMMFRRTTTVAQEEDRTMKLLRFTKALMVTMGWVMVAKVGCICDRETKRAWQAGERFDHVDDAIDRLEQAWVALVGK